MVEILETSTGRAGQDSPGMREFSAAEITEALRIQRAAFLRDGPPSLALRRNRMDRISALSFENVDGDRRRDERGLRHPLELRPPLCVEIWPRSAISRTSAATWAGG